MPAKKTNFRKSTLTKPKPHPFVSAETGNFLVAAVGASAGGVEAFMELVTNLPADTGMAFVLIQHLDPKHESLLSGLLSRKSAMPVKQVTDGMRVEPDHIYVIPPNATMTLSDHTFHLERRGESSTAHMPVDLFMRSLAEQLRHRAIGVILSGFGTDGTLGMAEIQAQGGVTFAQDEESAKHDGMPHSVITAGCVDYVLPPRDIAGELARIAQHPYVAPTRYDDTEAHAEPANGLSSIFRLLRRATGLDFTHYRQTTILRRIQRRMVVHRIAKLDDYVKFLLSNPAETKALYQDMLINVTSFFRDPAVFDSLQSQVFPEILKSHSPDRSVRIWTPACASGEETYSLAISFLEFLGERFSQVSLQFFGTDVSDASINRARAGFYPDNIQSDVSLERLRRYFNRVEGGYRISKNIRDMCIFAQHNVLRDPPFSQMDLICCRNLLIYLEPVLQNKIISVFHYAAVPGGFLVLGNSEGIGAASGLFSIVDRAHKIFAKKTTATRQIVNFSLNQPVDRSDLGTVRVPAKRPDSTWNYLEAQKEFDRRLLGHFAPATVFVNEDMEIVHSRGNVNQYIKLSPGRPSLSILKMAREGLLLDLRNAIARAKKDQISVRKTNIQIKNGNCDDTGNGHGYAGTKHAPRTGSHQGRSVGLEVVPLSLGNLKELYYMIVFHEEAVVRVPPQRRSLEKRNADDTARIAQLEQELSVTKEYLQSVIETQEATNEELQSANEEILSSNEELQSTNEELETAKEELQSANEELTTVNDELRNRNVEITQVNADLTNVLGSIEIAIVTVGGDLMIRRFTAEAQKYLALIPSDVGRPLANINPTIEIPDFQSLVLQVISSQRPVQRALTGAQGQHLQMRILPNRTSDHQTDGAVIIIMGLASKGISSGD